MDFEDLEFEKISDLKKMRHTLSELFKEISNDLESLKRNESVDNSEVLSERHKAISKLNRKLYKLSDLVDSPTEDFLLSMYPLKKTFKAKEESETISAFDQMMDDLLLRIGGVIEQKLSDERMSSPSYGSYCPNCNQRPCCCSDPF